MPVRGAESSLPATTPRQRKQNKRAVAAAEKAQKALNAHAQALAQAEKPNPRAYMAKEVTNPKPNYARDLKVLGFQRASQLHAARQAYQALQGPRLEAAGPIKPEPLPKGFTGFTPRQEKQASRLAAHPYGSLAGAAEFPGRTAAQTALLGGLLARTGAHDVAQTVRNIPANAAYGTGVSNNRPVQQAEFAPLVRTVGEQFVRDLFKDVTDPRHRAPQLALDLLAFGSAGVGGAARLAQAGRAAREGDSVLAALKARPVPENMLPRRLLPAENPTVRSLTEPATGGRVNLSLQSRNVLTAGLQHTLDRLSERFPGAPGVGAKARIARRIPEVQALRTQRATERAIPLALAAKALRSKKFARMRPAEIAYTVIARYGHTGQEGVRLLDMEIANRTRDLANLTGKAAKFQERRIKGLEAARELVRNPSPQLVQALTLGRQASRATTAMRIERDRGALSNTAAETAPGQHIRLLHDAEYVAPTAAREGSVSPALERQRKEVDRLQGLYDRAVAREAKMPKSSEARRLHETRPESQAAQGPIARGLGAAVSVQKDKLARMEAAAAKRVQPTGIVGAEHIIPGPHGFFTPDRQDQARLASLFRRKRSIKAPSDRPHARTGALYKSAQEQQGPTVTLKDYLQEVQRSGQQADAELALSFSRPFDPVADADALASGKLRLLNPEAKKIPRQEISQIPDIELESLTPGQVLQRAYDDRKEWVSNLFPANTGVAPAEHRLGLRVVDGKIAKSIEGLNLYQGQVEHAVLRVVDGINNFERLLLVYANPAYGPVQFTGNLAFLALQQNVEFLPSLARNARLIRQATPGLLDWIDMEVGGGAAASLAHEAGRSAGIPITKAASEKLTDVQNLLADRGPRRQAWLYEAHKEGFDTIPKIEQLRDNPDLQPVLDRISERAQQAMVKFRRTPTPLRRSLSKVIFILPWVEGSTRYVGRLILDRPFTARAAQFIRERVQEQQHKVLKGAEQGVRGFIPIKGTTGINPMSISPFSTPVDVYAALRNLATGHVTGPGLNPAGFLQPLLAGGVEAATHQNTYGGYQYPSSMSGLDILRQNLIGTTGRPAGGLANIVSTAFRHPGPLTGPPSRQPVYKPEGGVEAALMRAGMGSVRPRTVNLPAAAARGREVRRANMSKTERVADNYAQQQKDLLAAARKAGYKGTALPAPVRKAFAAQAHRYQVYEQVGANTQQEKFLADVTDLVKRGKLPKQSLSVARKFVAGKPTDRAVRHQRDLLGSAFYGTDVTAEARREINAATGG